MSFPPSMTNARQLNSGDSGCGQTPLWVFQFLSTTLTLWIVFPHQLNKTITEHQHNKLKTSINAGIFTAKMEKTVISVLINDQ